MPSTQFFYIIHNCQDDPHLPITPASVQLPVMLEWVIWTIWFICYFFVLADMLSGVCSHTSTLLCKKGSEVYTAIRSVILLCLAAQTKCLCDSYYLGLGEQEMYKISDELFDIYIRKWQSIEKWKCAQERELFLEDLIFRAEIWPK